MSFLGQFILITVLFTDFNYLIPFHFISQHRLIFSLSGKYFPAFNTIYFYIKTNFQFISMPPYDLMV
jgi:hypothetical protein